MHPYRSSQLARFSFPKLVRSSRQFFEHFLEHFLEQFFHRCHLVLRHQQEVQKIEQVQGGEDQGRQIEEEEEQGQGGRRRMAA